MTALKSTHLWGSTRGHGKTSIESLHVPKLSCGPKCISGDNTLYLPHETAMYINKWLLKDINITSVLTQAIYAQRRP